MGTHWQWEWPGQLGCQIHMCHSRPPSHFSSLQASSSTDHLNPLLQSANRACYNSIQATYVSQSSRLISDVLNCSTCTLLVADVVGWAVLAEEQMWLQRTFKQKAALKKQIGNRNSRASGLSQKRTSEARITPSLLTCLGEAHHRVTFWNKESGSRHPGLKRTAAFIWGWLSKALCQLEKCHCPCNIPDVAMKVILVPSLLQQLFACWRYLGNGWARDACIVIHST